MGLQRKTQKNPGKKIYRKRRHEDRGGGVERAVEICVENYKEGKFTLGKKTAGHRVKGTINQKKKE